MKTAYNGRKLFKSYKNSDKFYIFVWKYKHVERENKVASKNQSEGMFI